MIRPSTHPFHWILLDITGHLPTTDALTINVGSATCTGVAGGVTNATATRSTGFTFKSPSEGAGR